MDRTIKERFLKGFGANIYGQIVVAAIQLVGVPVLLYAWGPQLYGEWLTLFAIPLYLSFTDLGFSQSASNDMCALVVRNDQQQALAVFQSLLALVYGVAIIGILIIGIFLWFIPINHWLHFVDLNNAQTRWVLWLLVVEVFVRLTKGSSRAGFSACGEYGLYVLIDFSTILVQYVGMWCAALLGYGPVGAAAIYMLVHVASSVLVVLLLLHRHSWLRYGLTCARLVELRRLLKPALANISLPLAQAFSIQGMVLVVGTVLGPLAVVVFSTLRTLTRLALQGALTVSNALEPELAFAWGARDTELLRRLYVYSLGYSFWLSLAAAITLYFLGTWVLGIWTHYRVGMNKLLFDWLLLSSLVGAFWYSGLILRKAANLHLRASCWYLGASLATVALAAILLHFTGKLSDAGLALLLIDVLMAIYILGRTRQLLHLPIVQLLREMLNLYGLLQPVLVLMRNTRQVPSH